MKSFQNFAYTITEAEEKTRPKINISGPEILPMQPEGEISPSKPSTPKKKASKPKTGTAKPVGGREEAIKKGYVSPEGRVQERGVVTNRIRAGALGYGDAGKDPSKYGINPVEVSKEKTTLFSRATSPLKPERISARKEIKTAVKSIEKRYPGATERTGTSFRGFSRSIDAPKPSQKDISTLQRMARPQTSSSSAQALSRQLGGTLHFVGGTGAGKRAQAASDAAKDIQSYEKKLGFHQRVMQAVRDLPPEPTAPKPTIKPKPLPPKPATVATPKPVAPSSVSLSVTRPPAPKVSAGPALSVSTPKPLKALKPEPITAKNLGKVVTDVLKTEREAKAAEKAVKAAKTAKALSGAAKAAGLLGAGIEAKGAYDIARSKGAGFKTSVGAAAARGLGALGGAAVGGALGSVLGPVGSAAGGVAGYTAGSQLASKAYDVLRGDVTKPITSQSILRNIRRAVPQDVRAQVPAGARKAFRDLVTSTGRAYGNWQRSQGENR